MRLVLGVISTVVIGLGVMMYLPNDPVDFMGIPVGGKRSDIEDFEKNYRESGNRYINSMGIRSYSFCKRHQFISIGDGISSYGCVDENSLTFLESSDRIERAQVARTIDIQQLESNYQDILEKYGKPIFDETVIDTMGRERRRLTFGKQNNLIVKVVVVIILNTDPGMAEIIIQVDTGNIFVMNIK